MNESGMDFYLQQQVMELEKELDRKDHQIDALLEKLDRLEKRLLNGGSNGKR